MSALQNLDMWRGEIEEAFAELQAEHPERFQKRLNLSWSNWGFGIEPLEQSLERLANNKLTYVELHGNHYGPDLGYRVEKTQRLLQQYGLSVSGVCGMFGKENDLSSNNPWELQAAIDYIRREIRFTADIGGSYLLVVPGAVGRPDRYDDTEWHRSVQALQIVADDFVSFGIRAAIEPIRAAETTVVHSVADAIRYIEDVDRPGIQHINGDIFHMQTEEAYIPRAILQAGDRLINLHLADSHRLAMGKGSIDVDTMLRALYLIGYNVQGRYLTPEPLGPGGAPYPARNERQDPAVLDALVADTVSYLREREEAVLGA